MKLETGKQRYRCRCCCYLCVMNIARFLFSKRDRIYKPIQTHNHRGKWLCLFHHKMRYSDLHYVPGDFSSLAHKKASLFYEMYAYNSRWVWFVVAISVEIPCYCLVLCLATFRAQNNKQYHPTGDFIDGVLFGFSQTKLQYHGPIVRPIVSVCVQSL